MNSQMETIALVTGAGSGIGAGVARSLAAQGRFVALCDIDEAAAKSVQDEILAAGGKAISRKVDVTQEDQVASFVLWASEHGRPSVTVACAGIAATGQIPEMDSDVFRRIIDVNLTGVFLLAKHAIPLLRQGGGSFVALASDAGLNGFQGFGAYCASKHAVLGLVKSLALDHGPENVRCNAICPGYVETPMLDALLTELGAAREDAQKAVPLGRLARVADVAELVSFLVSDKGGYINGAALSLDGGGAAGPYFPA